MSCSPVLCILRGLRERGQKDVRVLARLVRTQSQSIIQDPLSCHRIMRRACRQGMGAHTDTQLGMGGAGGRTRLVNTHPLNVPTRYGQGCALLEA